VVAMTECLCTKDPGSLVRLKRRHRDKNGSHESSQDTDKGGKSAIHAWKGPTGAVLDEGGPTIQTSERTGRGNMAHDF
jgi:hypothetical protein